MNTQKIYNLVILDASGSMETIYTQALTGVNETLATIRMAQEEHPELQQYVTLASFSAGVHFLNRIYSAKPIAEASNITREDYPLLGCTALYDAMGTCISELQQKVTHGDRVLVTIITDGYENASRRYDYSTVKRMIEAQQEKGWEFVFLGANIDAAAEAGRIGIRPDRASQYMPDGIGNAAAYEAMASAQTSMRTCGSVDPTWNAAPREDVAKRGGFFRFH